MSSCAHLARFASDSSAVAALQKRFQKLAQKLREHPKELVCKHCDASMPHVWACLHPECDFIGCGRGQNKHALKHFDSHKNHGVCMNIKTRETYCYECDSAVIKIVEEEINASQTQGDKMDDDRAPEEDLRDILINKLTEILAPPMPKRSDDNDDEMAVAQPASPSSVSAASASPVKRRPPKYTPGLCGLDNLGNTCYMNAALQCLSNSAPLVDFFLHCDSTFGRKKIRFLEDFHKFFNAMWSGQYPRLSPQNIVFDVFQVNPQFRGYGQQDSQECLRTILDNLHERLKEEDFDAEAKEKAQREAAEMEQQKNHASDKLDASQIDGKVPHPLPKSPELSQQKPQQQQSTQRAIYSSIISSIFEGTLLSRVQCLHCGHASDTRDGFYDLSVSIPSGKLDDKIAKRKQMIGGSSSKTSPKPSKSGGGLFSGFFNMFASRRIDLYDCLHGFCVTDELTGKDKYRCENCKKLSDATKTFTIDTSPEVLCVHIKRFRYDTYFGTKISDHVVFPLEGLDLTPFCITTSPDEADTFDTPARRENFKENPPLYDLIGIVNHMGALGGGHYIAYCKNQVNGKWYQFDDSRVTEVSIDTVKNAEAYILFYERRIPKGLEEARNAVEEMIEDHLSAKYAPGAADALKEVIVSKLWMQKWRTVQNPGPISNLGLVCKHGKLKKEISEHLADYTEALPTKAYKFLKDNYGSAGPQIASLETCSTCISPEALRKRRMVEIAAVQKLDRTNLSPGEPWFFLHSKWLGEWLAFASSGKREEPPGPISNSELFEADGTTIKQGLRRKVDYRGICQEVWEYFHSIYGGGPAIARSMLDIYSKPVPYESLSKEPTDSNDDKMEL